MSNAKKQPAKKAAKPKPETVTVQAVKRLVEAGEVYLPGDTFETTAKRAKALGPVVTEPGD